MKDIIIVGAGGCGREVLQWIMDINTINPTWNIKGFIADDKATAFSTIKCDIPILDTITDYKPLETDYFTCAIGSPQGKEAVVSKLKAKNAKFVNIIHPKSLISNNCIIGEGLIAYPYSVISPFTTCGNFVTLLSSSIGSCCSIGDFSSISSYCHIGNSVKLGSLCQLSSHSFISDNITLGNNVFVAAGSFVSNNFGDSIKLWGNPATEMPF